MYVPYFENELWLIIWLWQKYEKNLCVEDFGANILKSNWEWKTT